MSRALTGIALLAVVAALVVVAWLLDREPRALEPVPGPLEGLLSSLRAREEPLAAREPAEPARVPVRGEAPRAPDGAGEEGIAEPWLVRVTVLQRSSRSPIARAQVFLSAVDPEAVVKGTGTTDAHGRVELALDPARSRRGEGGHARVLFDEEGEFFHAATDERELFDGPVRLEEEIVLLVPDCVALHGRIITPRDYPWRAVGVSAFEPARGALSTDVLLGRSDVDPWSAFSIPVCRDPLALVRLQVGLQEGSFERLVSWQELVSEEGARIELDFGELLVHVLDGGGRPLAGAEVRATSAEEPFAFPLVRQTDADGGARFLLPIAGGLVCAGKRGYSSALEPVALAPGRERAELVLALRALDVRDTLAGLVVRPDGRPIEEAWVTIQPHATNGDLSLVGMAQTKSAANGSFRLAIGTDRELVAIAYRNDLGISDELRFIPDGRALELVIRPQGGLRVEVEPPGDRAEFGGGLVEYALADRNVDALRNGHDFALPFEIGELPAGAYNLFVLVRGWDAWAEGAVEVAAGETRAVRLRSQPARHARGRLLRADGAPCAGTALRIDHPDWPTALEELWGTATGEDGSFELLLGGASRARLQVFEGERPCEALPLAAGSGQTLVRH